MESKMPDLEKTIKLLEALYDSMHKNQCYACSYEFIDVAQEFGTNIVADAIELLKVVKKGRKMEKKLLIIKAIIWIAFIIWFLFYQKII